MHHTLCTIINGSALLVLGCHVVCCAAPVLQIVTRAGSWPLIPSQGLVSSLQCTINPQTLLAGWQHCRRCSHAQREWRDCWEVVVVGGCFLWGGGGVFRTFEQHRSIGAYPDNQSQLLCTIRNTEYTACQQPLIWLLTCMTLSPARCLCGPQVLHSRP